MANWKHRRREPEDAWQVFSFSKLEDLADCPLRFYFQNVLRLDVPTTVLRAVGSSLHYMAYRFYSPTVNYKSADSFAGAWTHHWMGVTNGEFGVNGPRDKRPQAIAWNHDGERWYWLNRGKEIMRGFYDANHSRKGTGVGVMREQRFRINLFGFTVNGIIDRVDEFDDGVEIVDYKMGRYKSLMLRHSLQPTIYQAAYEHVLRHKFRGKPLRAMHIETLNPEPESQPIPLRTDDDYTRLQKFIYEASAYVRGVLTGASPDPRQGITFTYFNQGHIVDQLFRPRLPRGKHCDICPYTAQCESWERDHPQPTASQTWQNVRERVWQEQHPTQLAFPFDIPKIEPRKKRRPPRKR